MSAFKKDPIILYFMAGAKPTSREMAEIFMLGSNVRVRNGNVAEHSAAGAIEQCDAVSGPCVPALYRDKPDGEEKLYEVREQIIADIRATEAPLLEQQEQLQSEETDRLNAEAAQREADAKKSGTPKADAKASTAWVASKT